MKNKKAYISIEATFAITAILILFSLLIGFFGFMVPRMYLEKEVQTLAQMVKINGGLTSQQYNDAVALLGKYGDEIVINVYSVNSPATQLIDIAPKGTPYNACMDTNSFVPFARRSNSERIVVKVEIRLSTQQLLSILSSVGITALDSKYTIYETILSERNQC